MSRLFGFVEGDCLEVLTDQEEHSVNLIVTSPPYADARKNTYGGVPIGEYVEWWMRRAEQFARVLTPDGSLILNIKERVVNGERSNYVMKLVLAMQDAGWLWVDDYIWHKKNCFPGKWPNRFRDAWEHCFHFTRQKRFYMDQSAVMVPIGDWAKSRMKNLSEKDQIRDPSASGSPFGKNVSNWKERDLVYPTNVLHFAEQECGYDESQGDVADFLCMIFEESAEIRTNVLHFATECGYVGHSAAFPEELPEFFIKLFSRPGDLICDPFVGSGTTCVVADRLDRQYLGIDTLEKNIELSKRRIGLTETGLTETEHAREQTGKPAVRLA